MKKIAALLVSAALLISCVHTSPLESLDVSLSSGSPDWSYGSKQKIIWSLSHSSEDYILVFFLENESVRGCIGSHTTSGRTGEINYVANTVMDGDGNMIHLQNGEYRLTAALYQAVESADIRSVPCRFERRTPLAEKTVGTVTIADSDLQDGTN